MSYEKIIEEIDTILVDGYEPSSEVREKFETLCFDLWFHPYKSNKLSELQGDIIDKFSKVTPIKISNFFFLLSGQNLVSK